MGGRGTYAAGNNVAYHKDKNKDGETVQEIEIFYRFIGKTGIGHYIPKSEMNDEEAVESA